MVTTQTNCPAVSASNQGPRCSVLCVVVFEIRHHGNHPDKLSTCLIRLMLRSCEAVLCV